MLSLSFAIEFIQILNRELKNWRLENAFNELQRSIFPPFCVWNESNFDFHALNDYENNSYFAYNHTWQENVSCKEIDFVFSTTHKPGGLTSDTQHHPIHNSMKTKRIASKQYYITRVSTDKAPAYLRSWRWILLLNTQTV